MKTQNSKKKIAESLFFSIGTIGALILYVLIFVAISGCNSNSNPLDTTDRISTPQSGWTTIFSATGVTFSNYNLTHSETYMDYHLPKIDFTSSDSLIVSFDYLIANDIGFASNHVQIFQPISVMAHIGELPGSDTYQHYQDTIPSSPYAANDYTILRISCLYNCTSYHLSNLNIYKRTQ